MLFCRPHLPGAERWLAFVLLLGAAACSGESSPIRVIGSVPTAAPRLAAPATPGVPALGGVDQVQAFPIEKGLILSGSLGSLRTASLGPDGAFDIELDDSRDWMLVLVDSTQTGAARFVSYVGATVSGGSLIALPTAGADGTTIEVGTVAGSGDTWEGSSEVPATTFGLSSATLSQLAQLDAAFKNLRNLLVNFDGSTFYMVSPGFKFQYMQGTAPAVLHENTWADPGAFHPTSIWGMQLATNSAAVTIDALCGTPRVDYFMEFPDGTRSTTEGLVCEMVNGQWRATNGPLGAFGSPDDPSLPLESHIAISFGETVGEIPHGLFKFGAGTATLAEFDLAVARPVDANGLPLGLVPSVRIETDASHRVTGVSARFFVVDAQGAYVEVTDVEVLRHTLTDIGIDLEHAGGASESMRLDPTSQASVTPAQAWFLAGAGDPARAVTGFRVFIGNGGILRQYFGDVQ